MQPVLSTGDYSLGVTTPGMPGRRPRPWWRERELFVLLILAAGFYTFRVADLSVRGEESRRGRIAWEIWQTGDWIVPRIQGEPVFFRPPLQNWLIALVGVVRGSVDEWALRLPSVAAILIMVAITYGYGRSFLSSVWGILLRTVIFEPGTSAGTGPSGRDGFAVYAFSGRFVVDLEMVSKRRHVSQTRLVRKLRAGGFGHADERAAGPALFLRIGVALLSDHPPPAVAVLGRSSGRAPHGTGHRGTLAGSLHDQDGILGVESRSIFMTWALGSSISRPPPSLNTCSPIRWSCSPALFCLGPCGLPAS